MASGIPQGGTRTVPMGKNGKKQSGYLIVALNPEGSKTSLPMKLPMRIPITYFAHVEHGEPMLKNFSVVKNNSQMHLPRTITELQHSKIIEEQELLYLPLKTPSSQPWKTPAKQQIKTCN